MNDEKEGHQYRHEEKDEQGNVQGQFGYRDAKGQFRQVEYVADGYGFRAKVKTNEAGLDKQNPANVEIHKEEGDDFQKEYTMNVDTDHSGDVNVQHSEKSSSSNYYHQQPMESKPHGAPKSYYREPAVESEPHSQSHHYRQPVGNEPHGAFHHYHRQPVEKEANGESDPYYRPPVVESEPHGISKHYYRQSVESEPHSASENYQRQPAVEIEPHSNNYEYESKNANPYATYVDYGYPHTAEQESDGHHKNQNEEPEGSAPISNQHFMKEHNPQSEEDSSEKYHSMPRTEIYKKVHKIVPPQSYVEKTPSRTPSTYQYELQMDGRTYKYVKKPTSGREQPQTYHPGKEYHTNRPQHTEQNLQEMNMKTPDSYHLDDYQEATKENDENYDSREQKLILPQSGENEYNIHSYQSAYPHNHDGSNQDNPNEESDELNYGYDGYYSKTHMKEAEPETKAVPATRQYAQIDTDNDSYRYRHAPQEQNIVQPQQIVIMEPRKKKHMHEKVTAYGGNTYQQMPPSSLQSLAYDTKNNGHQPLKKAVLELNPEVYKKLMENKSPGQRIVAVPVNGENAGNSAPGSEPPHGVLHITLDGESSFNPKAAPLVLHIGQKPRESSRNSGRKYHVPSHHAYSQSSATPMYKPNTKNHMNKDWIPMTPAWRSRMGRTSTNGDSKQVSSGEGFKFLQAESSNRKVDFQRQPPKTVANVRTRVIPGIYIINTSKRVSKSKESKSTQGHTLISLTRP